MLQNLLEQLRSAGTGSKVIAGLVLLAVIGIGATAAVVARRPHFELLYSGLSASESAEIQKALANAGIPFEQSQPPGPFIVYVDRSTRYSAMGAVASAGALDRPEGGIMTADKGFATVFMSAAERAQVTLKRNWQEMEHMLEELSFVSKAKVTTSSSNASPFGGEARKTGSVMLNLIGLGPLTKVQGQSVANLVQFGLGIEPSNLNISDQNGNILYEGSRFDSSGMSSGDWMEQKRLFEQDLENRANSVLAMILGDNKARVTVISTWKHDLQTTVAESSDPASKVIISETVSTSKTPQGSGPAVGGPAGPGSNVDGFNPDTAGAPAASGGSDQVAKSDDTTRQYWAPRETTRTVSLTPTLEHLSVALYLDESLIDSKEKLESSVKSTVGFMEARSDNFSSVLMPFPTTEVEEGDAADGAGAPAEEPSEPSPMMEMLLERGVEIVSALAFLFILMKSLKSVSKASESVTESQVTSEFSEDDEMLDRLAQAQIDELVKSDPERVGQILSAWAGEEKATVGS